MRNLARVHDAVTPGGIGQTFRRLGIWGYVLVGAFIVIVAYFLIVHLEHLAAYSTIIFFVIFMLLHLFMHAGHGHHGGGMGGSRAGHGDDTEESAQTKPYQPR